MVGKQVLPRLLTEEAHHKSLAAKFPQLLSAWDYEVNGEITPDNISASSDAVVGWKCDAGNNHRWRESIWQRTHAVNHDCHFCTHRRLLTGFNDLETLFPELAKEFHPTKNGDLTPGTIRAYCSTEVWWYCFTCSHEWKTKGTSSRTVTGAGCKKCGDKNRNKIQSKFLSDFPEIVKQLHPIKSKYIIPSLIRKSDSTQSLWWYAEKCGHEWQQKVVERIRAKTLCSVCSSRILVSGVNDMATTHPNLAAQLHPTLNGDITATTIFANYSKLLHWLCPICKQSWQDSGAHRVGGRECNVCAGKRVVVGVNDLASQYPSIAAEYHPTKNNGLKTPHELTVNSPQKTWWLGLCGHEWQTAVYNRTMGKGCDICSIYIIEQLFIDTLSDVLMLSGEDKFTKSKVYAPGMRYNSTEVDGLGYYQGRKIVVEYDGSYWHSKDVAVTRDIRKTNILLAQGYTVIRIRESTRKTALPLLDIKDNSLIQIGFDYSCSRIDEKVLSRCKDIKNLLSIKL